MLILRFRWESVRMHAGSRDVPTHAYAFEFCLIILILMVPVLYMCAAVAIVRDHETNIIEFTFEFENSSLNFVHDRDFDHDDL